MNPSCSAGGSVNSAAALEDSQAVPQMDKRRVTMEFSNL